MKHWVSHQIGEFFTYTIPGEWGMPATLHSSVPVVRSTNFREDGSLDLTDFVFRAILPERLEKRKVSQGDILVEKSGGGPMQPAGRVVYCDADFGGTCSNFIEIAKVREQYDSKFIFYFLYQLYKSGLVLKYQQQTTGIINFKFGEYKLESVKIPSERAEQSAIAIVLSTVDRAIEQTEALIAKYQRIKTGLMHDLLTRGIDEHGNLRDPATHKFKDSPLGRIPEEWEAVTLKDLVRVLHGYAFSGNFYSDQDNGFILLTPGNFSVLGGLYFEPRNTKYYTGYVPEEFVLRNGDVLVVMTDLTKEMAILGNAVKLNHPYKILHNQRIGLVKPFHQEDIDSDFLVLVMNSAFGKSVIKAAATGTTVRHTSPDKICSALIPLPQPSEQKQITAVIEQMNGKEYSLKQQDAKLRRLKTGLMQDLLTGKVSVEPLIGR